LEFFTTALSLPQSWSALYECRASRHASKREESLSQDKSNRFNGRHFFAGSMWNVSAMHFHEPSICLPKTSSSLPVAGVEAVPGSFSTPVNFPVKSARLADRAT
jgi:hypothetical protein